MLEIIKSAKTGKDLGQRRRMRLYAILMVLFLSWAVFTIVKQQWSLHEKRQEYKKVQVQLEKVKKQNQTYKDEIKKLGDKEYIEQLLRSELYMTKDGEQLFLEGE